MNRSCWVAVVVIGFALLCLRGSAIGAQDGPFRIIVSSQGAKENVSQNAQLDAAHGSSAPLGAVNACDLNGDGKVDVTDVQLAVDQALNLAPCTDADLHLNNTCTVLDAQVIVTDIETGICLVPNCKSPLTYPSTDQFPSTAPACPPPLPPNPNPPNSTQDDGPIHPCMHVANQVRFQAIAVTGVTGDQPLNADLYLGTTCNPNNLIDQVFGGVLVPFYGNSLYWLTHLWDQPDTSAIWTVGNITTKCIDYSKVSDCN